MDDIPDWAWDRAKRMIDGQPNTGPGWAKSLAPIGAVRAFARYIAEHEEPPVDPLLIEAEQIVDKHTYTHDGLRYAVAEALRRGIEIGRANV